LWENIRMDEMSLRRRVELLEEEVRDLHQLIRALTPRQAEVPMPQQEVPQEPRPCMVTPPPLSVPAHPAQDSTTESERAWAKMARLKQEAAMLAQQAREQETASLVPPEPALADAAEDVAKDLEQRIIPEWSTADITPSTSAELRMGQVWAVRIGVLLLFTGFVFLANYAWEHYISQLGALPRLIMLACLAVGGVAAGETMRRKPRLGTYGEVISAGGLAALYYCAYAAHHIARLRVIESPSLGALLLTMAGMLILGYGVWRKASVMCSIALLLSFYGTSIQPVVLTAMISGLMLAVAGAYLCVRYRWRSLGVVGLVGAYAAYVLWQGLLNQAPAFSMGAWFLCCYWLLYNALILHTKNPWDEPQSVAICTLNHGLLAAFLPFHWAHFAWDESAWMVYAVMGAIVLGLWFLLEKFRGRHLLAEAHLVQGIGLLTLATMTKWSGHELFLILAVKGLALLGWDRWHKRLPLESCGFAVILISMVAALTTLETHVSPHIWLLYTILLFAALCLSRRDFAPDSDAPNVRHIARWILSIATLLVLVAGVLRPLPDAQGALWMIGISAALTLAARFLNKRFPAAEILPLAVALAVMAELYLFSNGLHISATTMLIGIALAFTHAIIHPQRADSWKAVDASMAQGAILSIAAWLLVAIYASIHHPLHPWTPLAAAALMVAVHALSSFRKWHIMTMATPLFSLAVTILSNPMHKDHAVAVYASLALVLVYAAWLTLREGETKTLLVPLYAGALALFLRFAQEPHCGIHLVAFAAALYFTPLRRWREWRMLIIAASSLAFIAYMADDTYKWAAYIAPTVFYAAMVYRARFLNLPSTHATKLIAAMLTATTAVKLSDWVGWHGEGHELTILWAFMAAFCFGMGFAMRERVMRLLMMLLLLATLGKILISVWQLGTLMRIASFLVTGAIFLLLGYVYNRYPEWFGKDDAEDQQARSPCP
jgi:uncharacterized membrane protein